MIVLRQHFNPAQDFNLEEVPFRPVPTWLGDFEFAMYVRGRNRLPAPLGALATQLAQLVPLQQFNTCFVQRYFAGQSVKPHRDPKNNLGYTVIAVFGDFSGAITSIPEGQVQLSAGDVGILPCTINNVQGAMHFVSPVMHGTRYTLILNTIE